MKKEEEGGRDKLGDDIQEQIDKFVMGEEFEQSMYKKDEQIKQDKVEECEQPLDESEP